MSTTVDEALQDHTQLRLPLSKLLLDPNNFRFADHEDYTIVEQAKIADLAIQRRTLNLVLGRNQENVDDLIDSLKASGWLPVDQIQVRKHSLGGYIVVEGNRRVATLKYLQGRHESAAIDLGALSPLLFENVPVVTYEDADEVHYLKLMGLKHISGNKKWPAINQAKFLGQLKAKGQTPDEICKAVGLSKRSFNLSLRTLALINRYRDSDYGDQFRSEQFNLFREVLNAPALRMWIEWDEAKSVANNEANLQRLFSWISKEEAGSDDEPSLEPAIVTTANMRELAEIVTDPKALDRLDAGRSLSKAREGSTTILKNQVRDALDAVIADSTVLFRLSGSFDEAELDEVEGLIKKLQGVAVGRGRFPTVFEAGVSVLPPFNQFPSHRFESITITSYRGHSGTELVGLKRINLFAGLNNSGKSTALEAVHLLAMQHDVTAILDVVRQRTRAERQPDPRWLVEQFPASARISGRFDGVSSNEASIGITFGREPDVAEQAFYLGTLAIKAQYNGTSQSSESLFRQNRDRSTHVKGSNVLCRSALYSPFSASDPSLLAACNKRSVETQNKEEILTFLRQHVDDGIVSIEMVDEWKRFMVSDKKLERGVDLAQVGDGMQRVFLMCLLFAWAEHGVVLLDEFENAIHAKLLPAVASFISDLSKKFNTQVFLTSHSKEAIDAIVRCNLGDELSAYNLRREDGRIRAQHYTGERVAELLELADFDLRGE